MNKSIGLTLAALTLGSTLFGSVAMASGNNRYQVTITNLTRGTSFTPMLVASHAPGPQLFDLGQAPSDALAMMAEAGETGPLLAELTASGKLYDSASSGVLLAPGESVTVTVGARKGYDRISVAGMLLPTNDGFVALNGAQAPLGRHAVTLFSPGYDAGSEHNDESCANIPGPYCGGAPYSADPGEGKVHIHAGIHGGGSLDPAEFDWRNPVARVVIERVRGGHHD